MATISGSGNIVALSATIADVTPSQSHLGIARSLLPAIQHLVATMPEAAWAVNLLAAHSSECLLRAAISRGLDEDPMKRDRDAHDLEHLWKGAVQVGLPVPHEAPQWITQLAALHRRPFQLRYPEKLNFIVLPSPSGIMGEAKGLLSVVETFVAAQVAGRDA